MRAALVILALTGCRIEDAVDCARADVAAGDTLECTMASYTDRAFDLRLPAAWDGSSPLPLIVALHGGGGSKSAAETVSCPDANRDDARCLGNVATTRGYAIVYPNGVGSRPLRGVRTWNAGGGQNGFVCGFGPACQLDLDDSAYIAGVLDVVEATIPLDPARIYATGISNGGAMSHRLACELSTRFAAVAPVAGANIFADSGSPCDVTMPILDIHGTEDSRWRYEGGDYGDENRAGYWSSVDETMENWRVRNGCADTFVDEPLPDADDDGTSSTRRRWTSCTAATERIMITGGGHTWPSGHQYLSVSLIGRVAYDFGSEVIVDFFDAHRR